MTMKWTENWNRSYKISIGWREYTVANYTVEAVGVVDITKVTEDDYTTVPSDARILGNLESEDFDTRGFTFSFDTQQTLSKESNDDENTILKLFNIDDDLITTLNHDNCIVIVEAGYQGYVEQVYSGDVVKVNNSRQGSDHVYEIHLRSGARDVKNTYSSLSYAETMSDKDIIKDLVSRFPNTTLGTIGLEDLSSTYKTGGRTFYGQHIDNLMQIFSEHSLTYVHTNGKINIVPLRLVENDENYENFSKTNYEIPENAFKTIGKVINNSGIGTADSKASKTVLNITTFFLPVEVGQFITIPSGDYVGDYKGTYKVTSRRISLNSSGGAWDSVLEVESI